MQWVVTWGEYLWVLSMTAVLWYIVDPDTWDNPNPNPILAHYNGIEVCYITVLQVAAQQMQHTESPS